MASYTSTDLTSPGWSHLLAMLRTDNNAKLQALAAGAARPSLRDGTALLIVNTASLTGVILSRVTQKTHPAVAALAPGDFHQLGGMLTKLARWTAAHAPHPEKP